MPHVKWNLINGHGYFLIFKNWTLCLEFDLVQKYGEGSVYEKPCPDCGYVVELQSSSVHITENGCTKVYCEDDEFNRSKCSYSDKGNYLMYVDVNYT